MLGLLKRRSKESAAPFSSIVRRYREAPPFPDLSYGTVRDYCDSADVFPELARHQNDLKDVERPWAIKAILNRLSPGARLLEVGSGEPLAAAALVNLGYEVTVCDPFDGSGNGPTEFAAYRARFPQVRFIRSRLNRDVAQTCMGFDCVFSISVLELDPSEALVGPQLKKMIPEVFELVERRGFGGTLLSYMTVHFDFKRANTDPLAARWLKVLMDIEHALIDTGILEDEFVFYVLRKKKGLFKVSCG